MRTPIFFRDMKCGIGLVLSLAVAWSVPSITHADHVTWTNCGKRAFSYLDLKKKIRCL